MEGLIDREMVLQIANETVDWYQDILNSNTRAGHSVDQ